MGCVAVGTCQKTACIFTGNDVSCDCRMQCSLTSFLSTKAILSPNCASLVRPSRLTWILVARQSTAVLVNYKDDPIDIEPKGIYSQSRLRSYYQSSTVFTKVSPLTLLRFLLTHLFYCSQQSILRIEPRPSLNSLSRDSNNYSEPFFHIPCKPASNTLFRP